MNALVWLSLIAIVTTVGFGWCGIGWYLAHQALMEVMKIQSGANDIGEP